MLTLDNDYTALGLKLRAECKARDIPFEQKELNGLGWGDVMFTGLDGLWSGEIKGAAEILGGIDHLEAQLQKQAKNCDRLSLYIYGRVEQAPDGNCYAFTHQGRDDVIWETHPDSGLHRVYNRRYFRMNYLGYRTKLARFYSQFGIEVMEVPDLDSLVVQLLAQYHVANSEGSTFSRFIPEKVHVREENPQRRLFMEQVMCLQAGFKEELADALCTAFESMSPHGATPTLKNLIWHLENHDPKELASAPLRSGKRTIGPAAVGKLRKALGI